MLLLLSIVNLLQAQTTIFSETMGTVGGTTTIAAHETANGFDNDSYTMTNGAATVSADIRATSASTGYTGASGSANVFFTTTNNQYGFAIEGIDASTFSSLQVQFGYRKENAANHATFAVEFWNGSAWVNVANTPANLFNEANNAALGWYLSKSLALPPAAQISGLKIRFLKSGTLSIRVDDVKLTGIAGATPTITPSVASLTGFNYVFGLGPSSSQSFTFTGSDLTGFPGNITVDAGVTAYEVSSDNTNFFSSVNYAFSGASLGTQTVYVRLKASQSVGSYNLQAISITGGGASAGITASGTVDPAVPSITVGAITPTNIFSTPTGTPSAASTFTVTGINLTDPITVSAVAGYEYSDNGGFTWSSSLLYNTVTVNKTIQVRLTGASAGNYNGTITIESLNALNSPSTISLVGQTILVPTLTEIIVPQYMQGFNGANNNRLPCPFRVTINNLNPNSTYRYFNTGVVVSDPANNNGAGVPIFTNAIPWVRTTAVGLSTPGQFGEFDTDGSGSYTGWFILEPSGNARFTPGNDVFMRIMLNDGAGGNTVVNRVTTTSSVKVVNLVASAGVNNGTGIRSVSNGAVRDFIYLFDNDLGTGRPISGTFFESDGTTGGTAYPTFYQSSVEGVAKAWGTLIPNTLPNGIRYVASYSRVSGNQLCTFSDADGVWPTGNINTVNPTGGATALVLANADVPMQCFLLPYANLTLSSATATEAAASTITITATITGTLASPQTLDVDVSGLGITAGDYNITGTTINIPAGVNPSGSVTLTVVNDILFEGIETATIAILNPSAGIELGFNISLDLNITDNDVPKVVINEIMYNSLGADEEWVELYNNDIVSVTVDSTWSIQGTPSSGVAWTRTFPPATSILLAPGQYITVKLGTAGTFPFAATISLSAASDQLTNTGAALIFRIGAAIIDQVNYSPVTFTPAANGFGPSLSLNNPNDDNSLPASWGACKIDGTPNLVNYNCDAATYYSILSGTLNPDAFNASTAIWSDTPTGTEGLCPPFSSTKNYVIRNGNTVQLNYTTTVPSMKNLTINPGGKLFTNVNTSGAEKFIRIYGNITNNGVLGNGTTYDALGLSIEGTNTTISGAGSNNLAIVRKDLNTNLSSTLTLNANLNLRYPGTAFYNNIAGTSLNLVVNSARYLILTDAAGSMAIDGIDGNGTGDRNGNITINGSLIIPDRLYGLTNNTPAAPCSLTINSTGKVTVANFDSNISGNGGTLGAFSVSINSGGKLEITKILKVIAGDLNSNGGIVIKSSSTQTGLIDGSAAGNVIGDVLVERKIGPLSGYHFLSSPVQNALVNNTTSGWRDDFTILSSVNNLQFIPGATYSVIPTVFEYDETDLNPNSSYGYIGYTGTTDPITPLKGFACVVPGNTTVDVFGPVNNGPINFNVTKASDGINLIGNPYPSPINWTTFQSHNTNLSTTYNAFVTSGGYNGTYGEYNSFTSLGTNGVGNIIASSQAFLVTANTAGAIQALNTDRTTDLTPTFFSQPAITNDVLRLELVKNDTHDEIIIFFAPSVSTDNFDELTDAKKRFPFNTDKSFLYSVNGNYNLAMNGLGEFNADKVIPLGIKVNASGSHSIIATDLSSFGPSAMIYLYDAQNGIVQNLRSNPSYSVNLDAGTHEGRFFIQFTPAVQLNIQNATCNGDDGKVTLVYNSNAVVNVSLKNQDGIEVASIPNFNGQHSINNMQTGNYEITYLYNSGYTSIDYFTVSGLTPVSLQAYASATQINVGENVNFSAINSTGNTTWNFGDGSTMTGNDVNHLFNVDGTYIVSATANNGECIKVIEIPVTVYSTTGIENLSNQSAQWLVSNNQIMIKFTETIEQNATFELIDLAGKLIFSKVINKGQNQYIISTTNIAEGIYVGKVNYGSEIFVKKLSIRK
ncbi:MAG TPA: PKD domain-containing protein [Bacteroidia bacterium]|nr:PKD domain-containing protein [Bacteroidia bacterium]